MKKLMMIAAMMVAAVSANAQFEPGTFSIQPKVGIAISNLTNVRTEKAIIGNVDFTSDKIANVGGYFGVEAEYQLSKMFSLAAGVNYSQQGCSWKETEFKGNMKLDDITLKNADLNQTLNLHYINVPVVANVYLFKGFALKAGVQFGFLVASDYIVDFSATHKSNVSGSDLGNTDMNISLNTNMKDSYEKFDIAIPMGLSYQFGSLPFVIDARYNLGLKKLNKGTYSNGDIKNGSFQLTVGYKFAL